MNFPAAKNSMQNVEKLLDRDELFYEKAKKQIKYQSTEITLLHFN
jgi:hypothetical protein